ncbi:hypothetical protein EKPJFOCH_2562 [Methylobacterium thuringiense]|uniref:Uncharacterized protein n=1 Tax=Methylobacterium thuringiense TaxID=1003091 RepID=A0ABQ4TL04_9HYPH|nr:hypothetical protein EKPJFOCH_2562 [Methylobacterium thuringiense]
MKSKTGFVVHSGSAKRLSFGSVAMAGAGASPCIRLQVEPHRAMKASESWACAAIARCGSLIQVSATLPSVRVMSPISSEGLALPRPFALPSSGAR